MDRTRPPRLPAGGTVAVVAPSSPVFERPTWRRGVDRLEQAGYRVTFGVHAHDRHGYLAGRAEDRADDLHAAFTDPSVDAIVALRGGYGAGQLLPLLDWELIRANPKPLIGMSDVTMLHTAIGQRAGLVTFWGPNLTGIGRATGYTWASFRDVLAGASPGVVDPAPDDAYVEMLVDGQAEGPLVGGTTSLVAATLGTPFELDTAGSILLLEDVGEEPYRIDRLLTQLVQAGKLAAAAGVVIGEHASVRPRRHEPAFTGGSLSLFDVLDEVVAPVGIPTMYGLPLGHGRHLATVPLGVPARIADGRLEVPDPGVR